MQVARFLVCIVLMSGLFARAFGMNVSSQHEEVLTEFNLLIYVLQQEQALYERKNHCSTVPRMVGVAVGAATLAAAICYLKMHAIACERQGNDFWGFRDERNDLHLYVPQRSISDE